jgi:hypothetical protein
MPFPRSFPTALRSVVLAVTLGISPSAGAAEPTPEARAHFKAGVEHLDAKRYDEAYWEFKAAYAISPKPAVLGNIGKTADRLERDGEAIDAYQGYLDGHPLSAREAKIVRRTLERLRAGIATVTLEAPGAFWIVDTRLDGEGRVVNEYGPFEGRAELRVRAGEHEIKLDRGSVDAPAWTASLFAGNAANHSFKVVEQLALPSETFTADADAPPTPADPAADVPPRSHMASYVLWGTGALAAIATPLLVLEANSIQNESEVDFTRRCPDGADPTNGCEAISDGSRRAAHWRTAALVTGLGAAGALVTGTVLFVLDSGDSQNSARAEAFVRPWVSPTGIGVSGTF